MYVFAHISSKSLGRVLIIVKLDGTKHACQWGVDSNKQLPSLKMLYLEGDGCSVQICCECDGLSSGCVISGVRTQSAATLS